MSKKVIIPNRGVIALDIIDALKSVGLETILLHSPEDSRSLPVKMADKSFKFYSSRLEDSYKDMETIIDKALELEADYIHPGYGFLAENPKFAELCEKNNIKFIGPSSDVLRTVRDKVGLRIAADKLGIKVLPYSKIIKTQVDLDDLPGDEKYPMLVKPVNGYGGKGIRLVEYKKDAQERINKMLKKEENNRFGLLTESYMPFAHHIEIPFMRDIKGNILFPPEIESSIQRRFQKIFQESPSINISDTLRKQLYHDTQRLIEELDFIGLGYVEFIVKDDIAYFSEINPTFQINTILSEMHVISNFIKKHFAICNGELLHGVDGVNIIKPSHHTLLVSLMSENPFDRFQPSSGTVSEFYSYSALNSTLKTYLYTGARVSPLYDPYIGKIATISSNRDHAIKDLKNFLNNIIIRGIRTNLPFLRHLLNSDCLCKGETIIDFLNLKCDFSKRKKGDDDIRVATALLSAVFHIENTKKNYKEKLQTMKQPGLLKRLFKRM
jgi:acetyl-CoA carboxylase, biotin carboxylase subunit